MPDLCTASDVKTYLGITDTASDTLFALLIPAISADLLAALNRLDLTPAATYTDALCGRGNGKLFLKHYPINSVASVKISGEDVAEWDENDPTTSGWFLDTDDPNPENRQCIQLYAITNDLPFWYCWPYACLPNIVVTYNAGYAANAIPAAIKQAAIEMVAFRRAMSQVQAQNQSASSQTLGDYSVTTGGSATVEFLGTEMPQTVADVIEKYRRVSI